MKRNEWAVETIEKACKGTVKSRGKGQIITKFCNDTREIKENEIFISIKPENGNGIKYIEEAFAKGAAGCITEYEITEEILRKYQDKIIIKVKDIIRAIQDMAKYKRNLYEIPVIGITGSVGKTTTKEMIATVLEKKYKTAKNRGNYNNHIGVPLTILDWEDDIETAIVEMGMNHLGEISELTQIANPTIAVITNVGTAHIGLLGSRENILKAKLEIFEGLKKGGKAVINNDNDMLNKTEIIYEKITYGIDEKSDYMARNVQINENSTEYTFEINKKQYKMYVPLAGKHFVYDSLCAISIGDLLKVEIEKMITAIKEFENTGKRNEIKEINGIKLINDYYNANFDSMKAGLETLSKITSKRKVAILGDMKELGKYEVELHKKVGREVEKHNVDVLITVGELAKNIAEEAKKLKVEQVYAFRSNEECIKSLQKIIKRGDAILLKASKTMWFGEIAKTIEEVKYEQD